MNENNQRANERIKNLFGLELNVVTFLSPFIIVLIFNVTKESTIDTMITNALTFSFTAYMFKLSRSYEQDQTDNNSFLKTLMVPRKSCVKEYFFVLIMILFMIITSIIIALTVYHGFHLDKSSSIVADILGGYYVSLAFVGSGYLSMLIVFDFLIYLIFSCKNGIYKGE